MLLHGILDFIKSHMFLMIFGSFCIQNPFSYPLYASSQPPASQPSSSQAASIQPVSQPASTLLSHMGGCGWEVGATHFYPRMPATFSRLQLCTQDCSSSVHRGGSQPQVPCHATAHSRWAHMPTLPTLGELTAHSGWAQMMPPGDFFNY